MIDVYDDIERNESFLEAKGFFQKHKYSLAGTGLILMVLMTSALFFLPGPPTQGLTTAGAKGLEAGMVGNATLSSALSEAISTTDTEKAEAAEKTQEAQTTGATQTTKKTQETQAAEDEGPKKVNMKLLGIPYDKSAEEVKKLPLRERMAYYFRYNASEPLPRKVWQTWKTRDDDPLFVEKFGKPHKTWDDLNLPDGFEVNVYSDEDMEKFLHEVFDIVPEIVEAYYTFPKKILRADFFRYLILYAYGGTYSDVDTVCLKSVNSWAPFIEDTVRKVYGKNYHCESQPESVPDYVINQATQETPVGVTIGIEAQSDNPKWMLYTARRVQFSQWTLQAKRAHPMYRELIARIVEQTSRKKEMNRLTKWEGQDWGATVMDWTGPGLYTDVAIDYLNNVITDGALGDGYGVDSKYWVEHKLYDLVHPEVQDKSGTPKSYGPQEVKWDTFYNLKEPVMVDDIMFLPKMSFDPPRDQLSDPLAYVQHQFAGSWKSDTEGSSAVRWRY